MLYLLILTVLAAEAISAGRSPNADAIEKYFATKTNPSFPQYVIEDATIDVVDLVTKYGYPIEVHNLTTSDGYKLTFHRIPYGRDSNNTPDNRKPKVFCLHGIIGSSADFVFLGPDVSLGYLLAENGYDVWIGNVRGTYYSRGHTTLNPNKDKEYWRFSLNEIGTIDVPTFLDYMEAQTNATRYHYIGHSQGGIVFHIMNSEKPKYSSKIISYQAFASSFYLKNSQSPVNRLLAPIGGVIETSVFVTTTGEIYRDNDALIWFFANFCYANSTFSPLCSKIIDKGPSGTGQDESPIFFGAKPAGCSIRQVNHLGQQVGKDQFKNFDFGFITNLMKYGSLTPPNYDIKKTTAPSYLHYSLHDEVVSPKDVELLASRLPLCKLYPVNSPTPFGHEEFIWGNRVKDLVYNKMISLMQQADNGVFLPDA